MKEIAAVAIGKLIEDHYAKDEHKFKAYAEFIAEAYKERGEVSNLKMSRSDIVITFRSPSINGYVLGAHSWTYHCPSLNLIEEIRKISGEW